MGRKQIEKTGVAAKKHWKVSEKIILIVAILLLLLGAIAIFGRTMVSMRLLGDETLGRRPAQHRNPNSFGTSGKNAEPVGGGGLRRPG